MVATTDGCSFFEYGLSAGTEFTYTVELLPSGTAAAITLTAVGGVAADAAGLGLGGQMYLPSAFELFWQRVDGAVAYRIEHDGRQAVASTRLREASVDTAMPEIKCFIFV